MLLCLLPRHPSLPSLLLLCFPLPSPFPYASPLHGPLPVQAFLLLDLSYGTAFSNFILFFQDLCLPVTAPLALVVGSICLRSVQPHSCLCSSSRLRLASARKKKFYFCSNSWNYRGQAVSCNALVLPGPVGAATV